MLLRDPVRSNRLCDLGGTWIRPAEVKMVVRAYYKGNHYKKRKQALAVVEQAEREKRLILDITGLGAWRSLIVLDNGMLIMTRFTMRSLRRRLGWAPPPIRAMV
jgi:hypothetical protein